MATDKVIPVCQTCKDAGTYLAQLTRERDQAQAVVGQWITLLQECQEALLIAEPPFGGSRTVYDKLCDRLWEALDGR